MKGFDTKALILFPNYDTYANKVGAYKYQFRKAATNLVAYLKSIDIEPHVFYTDDIARSLDLPGVKWVSTLSTADRFFLSRYVDGTSDALKREMIEYPDLYNKITAKYPGSIDMSVEARFELVNKHDSKCFKELTSQYKIVFNFIARNGTRYKVVSRPNDGKIRVNINAQTFVPTSYIGGNEENTADLLGVPYGSRSLDEWEVSEVIG